MGRLSWVVALLLIASTCGAQNQSQPASSQDVDQVFDSADAALDQARAAPKGARELVDQVLAELEVALTKHPDSAKLHMMMGRAQIVRDCMFGEDRCALRAKAHFTKAIELDPKLARAHVLLAHDAMNSGCLPCARPHLDTAGRIDPRSPYFLEATGRHSQLSGLKPDIWYRRAEAAFPMPKRGQLYLWMAEMYLNREDYAGAEQAYLKAVEVAPEGAWPNGNLGGYYIFIRGDYEKALSPLRKALSLMSFGYAREALNLALYERWGDAALKKTDSAAIDRYWNEALEASSDVQTMFFNSLAYEGSGHAARALLAYAKLPKSIIDQPWHKNYTPLIFALRKDSTELALDVLAYGANPHAPDPRGEFPVHIAAGYANFTLVDALARRGASLQVLTRENGESVFMRLAAAAKTKPDKQKTALYLLERGAQVNARSAHGGTALQRAVGARDVEFVRFLFSRGAKMDAEGAGHLMRDAILKNERDMVELLLDNGADINMRISDLSLPEFAERYFKPEIAKMLRARQQLRGS